MSRPASPIHLPSLALGCAAVLALGLASPPGGASAPAQSVRHTLAGGPGSWRDIVRIQEGFVFEVPEGHVLIVRSFGFTSDPPFNFAAPIQLEIDGTAALFVDPSSGSHTIDPGWVAEAGSRVTVKMDGEELVGYAFGFLAPV